MSSSSTPAWLREDDLEDITPLNIPGQTGSHSPSIQSAALDVDSNRHMRAMHYCLKAVTMLLCVLMTATAIIGVEYIDGVDAVSKIFVIVYMLFFSILLFLFEAVELRKIESVDHMFRRNFGFLYKAMGKALFIIFLAFLSFGLGEPLALSYATGTTWALFGFLEVGLYLKYPEWFEDNE